MLPEATSKHVGTATELTCLLPIKEGFLPTLDTRTYATRLRVVFKVLQTLRASSREIKTLRPVIDIVDAARTVHAFSWAILDDRLLLNVAFDRPWEPYIRVIWKDLGPLLDLFLCNCKGFVPSTGGFEPYAQFVRDHQVDVAFFYPSSSLSVDDQRYLIEFERVQRQGTGRGFSGKAARLVAPGAEELAAKDRSVEPDDARVQWLTALEALHGLRGFFPGAEERVLRRAAVALLRGSNPFDDGAARLVLPAAVEWLLREEPAGERRERRPLVAEEIQGGILEPYRKVSHGCLLLARIENPERARGFIGGLESRITSQAESERERTRFNVAFTANGLRNLGVPSSQLLRFPKEFRDGMEARAGFLGDVRHNHPDHWTLPEWNVPAGDGPSEQRPPIRMSTIDVVFILQNYGRRPEPTRWSETHPLFADITELCRSADEGGIRVLSVQEMHRMHKDPQDSRSKTIDHFQFAEGIGQPKVADVPQRPGEVELGELIVGFRNSRNDGDFLDPNEDRTTLRDSVLDKGSFLVIRKLRQDVGAFEDAVRKLTASGAITSDELLGKMMGRRRDGSLLSEAPGSPATNDFDFGGDPDGTKCPFHSHIRRANPRLGGASSGMTPPIVPRIARRGLAYGPPVSDAPREADRGMMFMAYNASIAEQFEIVQRWMSGGNTPTAGNGPSTYGGQPDPVLGLPDPDGGRWYRFVDDAGSVHHVDLGPVPFVTLQWGLYLFAPSIPALRLLSRPPEPDRSAGTFIEFGATVIERLKTKDDWAAVLEDISANVSGTTAAVLAAVRHKHSGVLKTEYGVLVASHALGMKVLTDDATFSVREYQARFRRSVGEGHLGMDSGQEYQEASAVPNEALREVREEEARNTAYETARKVLEGALKRSVDQATALGAMAPLNRNIPFQRSVPLPLEPVISTVLGQLAQRWFDIPDGELIKVGSEFPLSDELRCPFTFLAPSRYVFSSPHPRPEQKRLGTTNGASLLGAVRKFVQRNRAGGQMPSGPIAKYLFDRIADEELLARSLLGLVFGFVPTVHGTLLQVLGLWLSDETLWRVQQIAVSTPGSVAVRSKPVREAIERAMLTRPVPPLLHRTATKDAELGPVKVAKGHRLVIAVSGMTHELLNRNVLDVTPIFGGDRQAGPHPARPLHACPGYEIARGVIDGILLAILEVGVLRPTAAQITVRVEVPKV